MVGFSSAAITSNCDDISHRAVSTSAELDSLLKAINPGSIAAQHLISFSAKLDQFRDTAERLRKYLDGASAISPGLRNALVISVQPCADAAAVVDKQIRRLDPGNVTGLNADVILQFESYHMANTRLFTQYIQVVQMPTVVQQDSRLSAPDGHRLLETAVETSQIVLTRSDILQATEEPSSLEISSAGIAEESEETPTDAPLPDYASDKPSKGKSKATGQFFSSISSSFKAMTAGLRARPEPMVIAMCQAAKSGDVGHLKGFVSQGVNINGQNDEGYTPLICAIRANQIEAVGFLIKAGADRSSKDSFSGKKKPPLFHAAECGFVPIAELLMNNGADIKERSWSGQPFFIEVANSDKLDIIRLFLDRGCDANTSAISGRTIFIHAVQAGSLPHMKLLQEFGADMNARDITGQPALHMALGQNRMDIVSFLLEHGADPNVMDLTGSTMIISALHKKKYELVKMLLVRGADPNTTGLMGKGVLWTMLQSKDMEDAIKVDLVRSLLQRGANPNEVDNWGESIMSLVITLGNTELLRTFLTHGGNPNKKIKDDTFLLYAINQGRLEDAKLLLTHGADANAADNKGRTPLIEALQSENHTLVQTLLTFGADVNKMGNIKPLTLARLVQKPELVQMLTERGAQAPMPPKVELAPPTLTATLVGIGEGRDASTIYGSKRS
ncbi:putative arabinan endo-1,5-alpha-L-arabinosidase A [Colletotrichum spaethianum]|uniref:Arabinan endo-1,5-alpha-L-arabinosidase A n=1 Tax=Colletotrichum spaethianum TaxID=700344 RepID=A0AA37PFH6_9PEZI|nr:putative arabinan endo-1,5-alpha-L-arabinosidase A [Colletotrichum spaethianum]GKT51335.1 putative arabinan endo-1,5-alpha-L-arabinosidase A [Colletotrichum spaethianum]